MLHNEPPEAFANQLYDFVSESVFAIHKTQDANTYLDWIKVNHQRFLSSRLFNLPEDEMEKIALSFGRQIWNITPLKRNRYRPSPFPELKRNDKCYCGSGKKYKQCCMRIDTGPLAVPLTTSTIWPLLLEEMDIDEIDAALKVHALPVSALVTLAGQYEEDGMPADIVDILEPLFEQPADKMGEDECFAFTQLCNAYDDLELEDRKLQLLHRLKDDGSKLIRSEAWQRLASNLLDRGENQAAWQAFQTAQRLTPNSPSVDLLEITMLLGESKYEHARQRAKMVLNRLRKTGEYESSPLTGYLQEVIDDPENALEGITDSHLKRLAKWLKTVEDRRLPKYKLQKFDHEATWLEEEDDETEDVQLQLSFGDEDVEPAAKEELPEFQYCLQLPKTIKNLERRWDEMLQGDDPYMEEAETSLWEDPQWLDFLEQNPQSFGSPHIISNIIQALGEWKPDPWIDENILMPLLLRGQQIYASLPQPCTPLSWGFLENRPLLRLLEHYATKLELTGQHEEAIRHYERMLVINPNDNHDYRSMLVNEYLRNRDYKKAQKLVRQYPNDMLLEIPMAKVLLLFIMGREEQARREWQKVKGLNKHIQKFMASSQIAQPEFSSFGVEAGGEDQAWLYRREMRDVWLSYKGAITWLKKN